MATGSRAAHLLPKMFGPELVRAFGEFKAAWDPENRMNPHKVIDPYLPTENLRLGADYSAADPHTHFAFPEDHHSFASAALRCIGLGACRKQDSGTMCPSYMATLEEEHSTRGRAHMLFEMLQGEITSGGWNDEGVKKSLDLCLSCKACKTECPANVDVATYKAEFLAHYYQGHHRPLRAYAFGMIDKWLRLGSIAPGLVNALNRAPGFSHLLRAILELAPQRQLPSLAPQTFRRWARKQNVPDAAEAASVNDYRCDKPRVILWLDTFNNYLHPETARAAFEVLQAPISKSASRIKPSAVGVPSTISACSTKPRNICSEF